MIQVCIRVQLDDGTQTLYEQKFDSAKIARRTALEQMNVLGERYSPHRVLLTISPAIRWAQLEEK